MIVLVLFAEDRGHLRAVQRLTDRLLCAPAERGPANWITEDNVEGLRCWRGIEEAVPFTPLKAIREIVPLLRTNRRRQDAALLPHGRPRSVTATDAAA